MADPRVVIAMAHTSDYMPLAELTAPTVAKYCEKWGYTFAYHPAWEKLHADDGDRMKVRIYKDLYEKNRCENGTQGKSWDVFVWIDADAMITNSELSVAQLLANMMVREDQHFLWGCDMKGPNTGVYIARFTPQAHMFLHASFCTSIEMGWGDNTAMIQTSVVTPHKEIIACVEGRYMNAYVYDLYGWGEYKWLGDWRTARDAGHDWVLHFPGIQTHPDSENPQRPNRLALVGEYLQECK